MFKKGVRTWKEVKNGPVGGSAQLSRGERKADGRLFLLKEGANFGGILIMGARKENAKKAVMTVSKFIAGVKKTRQGGPLKETPGRCLARSEKEKKNGGWEKRLGGSADSKKAAEL